ncbi:MAG: tetratricopeptide repeat protein [Candidatus Rokubacteria bacterium]|nr:tetratricopeptide repeat protein [Candidatus Rokubacteria bacterium]
MTTDAYGLPVTTSSPDALDAYVAGVEAALGWKASALERFQTATRHDPGLAVAHAGAAACLFLEERFPEAKAASDTARAALTPSVSARERSYVEAVTAWTAGRVPDAERLMREHLRAYPADLPIIQRLYFVFFWLGKFPEMLEATTLFVRQLPESSYMLGMHAFALEQAGRCSEAITFADAAIVKNPEDAWSIHALAHALYESAEFDAAIARLPGIIEPIRGLNWFQNHLWWHVLLMHLSRGEYDHVSTLAHDLFEREPSTIAGDLHDSISLLWRLELAGRSPGARWAPFAGIARERINRTGLLFHVAHVAMALAGGGDTASTEKQVAFLRDRAPKDATGLLGDLVVPLVEGIHAFAARDYAKTIAKIEPLASRIVLLGGSRAQRDVFHDTLLEACFRAGDMDRAERLLAARLARRRDHYWVNRRN